MAPPYAIPRLLQRNALNYSDIQLWEIHEAFAAQLLAHIKAWKALNSSATRPACRQPSAPSRASASTRTAGSIAIGHPFGATGARILSQAVKQLSTMPSGQRAIVSICADGGQGTVALLQAA